MKKYTSLFALLIIMTLLIIETVPQYRVLAQQPCGGRQQPACPPANPGNPGSPGKPGPKNHPTKVPTLVPTATPTLVPLKPIPHPYMYPILPYPITLYPTPVPHLPQVAQNLCKIGPCWLFNLLSGDPVELLAIGGFIVFLIVIGFVFLRSRNSAGRG